MKGRRLIAAIVLIAGCRDKQPIHDPGGRNMAAPVPSTGTAGTVERGPERDMFRFPKRAKQDPSRLDVRTGPLGAYVVDRSGRALYAFSDDAKGQTACFTNCSTVWPPVIVDELPRVESTAIDATKLTIFSRPDGSRQLAYFDMPLYYAESDLKPEDTWGHYAMSFGGRFALVSPGGQPLPPPR